ncbi:MAG TPA: hypothetical protein VGJ44_20260 [Kribbellaceae bacterium]|jgi:hypothetical protein
MSAETTYTRDHRPPVVASSMWCEVVARAAYRCQCTGQCGGRERGHEHNDERCTADAAIYQLAVAPAKPTMSAVRACRANAAQLIAWCGPCLDAAVRDARKAETAAVAARADLDQLELAGWSA